MWSGRCCTIDGCLHENQNPIVSDLTGRDFRRLEGEKSIPVYRRNDTLEAFETRYCISWEGRLQLIASSTIYSFNHIRRFRPVAATTYRFTGVKCEKSNHHGEIHNNTLADAFRPPSGPLPTLPFPDLRLLHHGPSHGREPYHGLETSRKPPSRCRIYCSPDRCNLTSPTTIQVIIVLF